MNPSYVPYTDLGSRPHAIVDGPPLDSTVLTLSHWPNDQTPAILRRDTSTATVFAYLEAPEHHRPVDIVSNNHFDEDGLFSMFTFCYPELALDYRAALEAGALAGDFGIVPDLDAARLCAVVEAFADPEESPLNKRIFEMCEARRTEFFYHELLPLLPDFLEDLPGYEQYWRDPCEHLETSQSLVASGRVAIEERPARDLAIVRIPDDLPERPVRRYLNTGQAAVHPFAINSATRCNRIMRFYRGGFDLHFRYESWLRFVSWRPQKRVALAGLADRLNAVEEAPGTWRGEGVDEVIPRLWLDGSMQSSLSEDRAVELVEDYLASAPAAWDPYEWHANKGGDD